MLSTVKIFRLQAQLLRHAPCKERPQAVDKNQLHQLPPTVTPCYARGMSCSTMEGIPTRQDHSAAHPLTLPWNFGTVNTNPLKSDGQAPYEP